MRETPAPNVPEAQRVQAEELAKRFHRYAFLFPLVFTLGLGVIAKSTEESVRQQLNFEQTLTWIDACIWAVALGVPGVVGAKALWIYREHRRLLEQISRQ